MWLFCFLFAALTMSDTREIIFMEALKHVWRSMKMFVIYIDSSSSRDILLRLFDANVLKTSDVNFNIYLSTFFLKCMMKNLPPSSPVADRTSPLLLQTLSAGAARLGSAHGFGAPPASSGPLPLPRPV